MSRLSLLVDLASLLAREVDLDALLSTACERVAEALRADRATIWLVDADHGSLICDEVRPDPQASSAAVPLGLTLDEATRRYVQATVDACDGNKTEAARRLGVGRNTVARALRRR